VLPRGCHIITTRGPIRSGHLDQSDQDMSSSRCHFHVNVRRGTEPHQQPALHRATSAASVHGATWLSLSWGNKWRFFLVIEDKQLHDEKRVCHGKWAVLWRNCLIHYGVSNVTRFLWRSQNHHKLVTKVFPWRILHVLWRKCFVIDANFVLVVVFCCSVVI
jgi:hypothetical protein